MPGPAPKPADQRRRRNVTPGTVMLPASGYDGDVPKYPLSPARAGESALWRELWTLPQANAWTRFGWSREVALYVRWLLEAEAGDTDAAREARMLSDRLGLSPLALLRLRWEIVPDDQIPGHAPAPTPAGVTDIRSRVKAVDDAVERTDDSG